MNYCVLCDNPGVDSIFNHRVCKDHKDAYVPIHDLIDQKYENEIMRIEKDRENTAKYHQSRLNTLHDKIDMLELDIDILKHDLQTAVYSLDYACNHPFRNLIRWMKKSGKGQGRVREGFPSTHAERFGQADGQ